MRQAAGIFRNATIVRETRDRFYVRERRPAQRQPFGLEDAATRLVQCRGRDILQHVGAPACENAKLKREAGFPPPLWSPVLSSAGLTGPGGRILSTVYSTAASVIGRTDTKVRPSAFGRNTRWPSILANSV